MSEPEEPQTEEEPELPRPRVLIVDDTPENLVALEVVLEDIECDVDTAGSGNEALGMLLKTEYALVLLDVQMPEMDGFEVAEIMRSNPRTANVPIIFVTAISKEDQYVKKGYQAGAVDYLFKPVDPTALHSKVNFFLQLDRQKKRLEAKLAKSRESEKALYEAYGQHPRDNE